MRLTPKIKKAPCAPEHREQQAVIQWAALHESRVPMLRWLHAIPNAAKRTAWVARMMKEEGLKAGVSDLCLPMACRAEGASYVGLYIEMKSRTGRPTPEQKEFLEAVWREGYYAFVAYGADEAIGILSWYCGLSEKRPEIERLK